MSRAAPLPRAAPRRSRGSMTLEAMIAVGIAAVLTAAAATVAVQTVRAHAAQRVASVIAQVDQAMRSYVLQRRTEIDACAVLRQGSPLAPCPAPSGSAVVDLMAPLVGELEAAKLLPAGFSGVVPGLMDNGVLVQVTVVPVPANPSLTNIEWMVYSNGPLKSSLASGGADVVLAAQAASLLRAPVGYSTLAQPGDLLVGPDDPNAPNPVDKTVPNPLGSQPAILAVMGGYSSSDLAAMLPRAGGTMTGAIAGLRASTAPGSSSAGDACTTLGLIVEEAGTGRLLTCQSRGGGLLALLPPVATGGQWVPETGGPFVGQKVITNTTTDRTWLVSASGGFSSDPACQGKYSLMAVEQGSNLELARMEDLSSAPVGTTRSASLQLPVPPQGALVLMSNLQCGSVIVGGTISVSTFRPQ